MSSTGQIALTYLLSLRPTPSAHFRQRCSPLGRNSVQLIARARLSVSTGSRPRPELPSWARAVLSEYARLGLWRRTVSTATKPSRRVVEADLEGVGERRLAGDSLREPPHHWFGLVSRRCRRGTLTSPWCPSFGVPGHASVGALGLWAFPEARWRAGSC